MTHNKELSKSIAYQAAVMTVTFLMVTSMIVGTITVVDDRKRDIGVAWAADVNNDTVFEDWEDQSPPGGWASTDVSIEGNYAIVGDSSNPETTVSTGASATDNVTVIYRTNATKNQNEDGARFTFRDNSGNNLFQVADVTTYCCGASNDRGFGVIHDFSSPVTIKDVGYNPEQYEWLQVHVEVLNWTSGKTKTTVYSKNGTELANVTYTENFNNNPSEEKLGAVKINKFGPGNVDALADDYYLGKPPSAAGSGGGGNEVSGTVQNQNGDPIENATVRITGASDNDPNIGGTTDAFDEIENVGDPIPTDWIDQQDSGFSVDSTLSEQESEIPLISPNTAPTDTEPTLTPDIEPIWKDVPANEEVTVTVWDPSKAGAFNIQGGFDSDVDPGASVKDERTIEFEKIGRDGSIIERQTVSTEKRGEGGIGYDGKYYNETVLTTGFWRVSLLGDSDVSYLIKVGPAEEVLFNRYQQDVNQTYSDRAQKIRDKLANVGNSDSGWVQKTVSTNGTGYWSASLGSDVKAVHVQAYKANDLDGNTSSLTPQDIEQNFSNGDVTGSLYLSTQPKQVEVPSSGVTLEMRELKYPPWGNTSQLLDKSDLRDQILDNLALSDLPPALQDRLRNIDRQQLEELYEDLADLRDRNADLRDRIDEIADEEEDINASQFNISVDDASDEELIDRINAIEQALTELQGSVNVEPGETDVGQESISQTFRVDGVDVEPAGVAVFADYSDGTSELVNDSYVSVDQSLATSLPGQSAGETVIRVEDYPLNGTDPAAVQFRVQLATEEGVGGAKSDPIENPASSVVPPGLQHVALSSTAPGPDERVTLSATPEEGQGFGSISNVTAYGPSGNELSTTQDGEKYRFTTNGQGVHQARITYTDVDGNEFTVPIRLGAQNASRDLPPTMRVRSAPAGGTFVVVGDGLQGGDISKNAGQSRVDLSATVGEETPSEVAIWAHDLTLPPDATVSFTAVRGSDQQALSERVGVTLHMPRVSDEGLLWYEDVGDNTEPFPAEGSRYGTWTQKSDQTLIQTATREDGTVALTVMSSPSLIDRVNYGVQNVLNNLPDPPSISLMAGLGLLLPEPFVAPPSPHSPPGPPGGPGGGGAAAP